MPHWDSSLQTRRRHTDPADLLRGGEGRWEGWQGERVERLGWQGSRGWRERLKGQTLGRVSPSVTFVMLHMRRTEKGVYMMQTRWQSDQNSSNMSFLAVNLGEQTHLPEVVISLLQSCELSQETLILSPLLVQLSTESGTRLWRSLMHTLWTHTWEVRKCVRYRMWGKNQPTKWLIPSCVFCCWSKRAESSSLSLFILSFSVCSTSSSFKSDNTIRIILKKIAANCVKWFPVGLLVWAEGSPGQPSPQLSSSLPPPSHW